MLAKVVERQDLDVDTARDGEEAIQRIDEDGYSVIVLDLMMPRVDGFGVIEYLRDHPQKSKPVVLVITAYADQKFKDVDADIVAGVLRKPFEVADLGNLVRLCVTGLDAAAKALLGASDRSIRELAERRWNAETTVDAGRGGN